MSERLRIAITKGRLLDKSMDLFDQMGLNTAPVRDPGRRLIHEIPNYPLDAVLSKAPDVITYVEQGVCDLGIVGKDTILEKGGSFYEVLDLGFGRCRFALAVKEGTDFYKGYKTRRIASKYPNVAKRFFANKGMDVDIIKIEGLRRVLFMEIYHQKYVGFNINPLVRDKVSYSFQLMPLGWELIYQFEELYLLVLKSLMGKSFVN